MALQGYEYFSIWTPLFFIFYILLVFVVLLNVAVAVLLEGFLRFKAECVHDGSIGKQS